VKPNVVTADPPLSPTKLGEYPVFFFSFVMRFNNRYKQRELSSRRKRQQSYQRSGGLSFEKRSLKGISINNDFSLQSRKLEQLFVDFEMATAQCTLSQRYSTSLNLFSKLAERVRSTRCSQSSSNPPSVRY